MLVLNLTSRFRWLPFIRRYREAKCRCWEVRWLWAQVCLYNFPGAKLAIKRFNAK